MLRAAPHDVGRQPRGPRVRRLGLGRLLAVGFIIFAFWGPGSPLLALRRCLSSSSPRRKSARAKRRLPRCPSSAPVRLAIPTRSRFRRETSWAWSSTSSCAPRSAFAVLHGKDLVGIVTREDVLRAAPKLGPAAPVSQIARRELRAVRAELPLDQLRGILIEQRSPAIVMANEGPLGVLTLEDLGRVAAVMQELASRGLRRPVPAPAPEGRRSRHHPDIVPAATPLRAAPESTGDDERRSTPERAPLPLLRRSLGALQLLRHALAARALHDAGVRL